MNEFDPPKIIHQEQRGKMVIQMALQSRSYTETCGSKFLDHWEASSVTKKSMISLQSICDSYRVLFIYLFFVVLILSIISPWHPGFSVLRNIMGCSNWSFFCL